MTTQRTATCELCARQRPITFHHLIPRTTHSNKWFKKNFTREQMQTGLDLCSDCHSAIHRFIPSVKELGRSYNTKAALLEHEDLAGFVTWVAKREGKTRYRTRGRR